MVMVAALAEAQETLITTDGEVMMVYIDDIGSTTIYYKTVDSANSQLQRIDKSKVYMIKRADGTKYDLGDTQTPAQQASTPAQPMNKELSEEAKQRNKELIDAFNKLAMQPEFNGTPTGKRPLAIYATLGVCDNSIICNDDIEIAYESSMGYQPGIKDEFILIITNKTNKTVFIDQANTFLVSNGESSPYYVPTAYSSSTSKTGDANAGTFAGAMGIHDYQTNVSTSTVYSQRVISIPPMAQKRLNSKWLFPTRSHLCCPGVFFHWSKFATKSFTGILRFYIGEKKSPILKEGDTLCFSQDNSPLKFTCHVTYSFKEDCEITNSISINLFMKKVICYGNSWKGYWLDNSTVVNYNSAPFFSGKITIDNKSKEYGGYDFEGTIFNSEQSVPTTSNSEKQTILQTLY